MSRRAASFTQAEVMRAILGAKACGLSVAGIRIDSAGLTILTNASPEPAARDLAADAALVDRRLGIVRDSPSSANGAGLDAISLANTPRKGSSRQGANRAARST
jgi:hypothetical protein